MDTIKGEVSQGPTLDRESKTIKECEECGK